MDDNDDDCFCDNCKKVAERRNNEKSKELDPKHQKFAKILDKIPTPEDLTKMFKGI